MKTKIIFAGLIALSFATHAQNTFPWSGSGWVGIGTTGPANYLHVSATTTANGGITIEQPNGSTTTGNASLRLINDPAFGGHQYDLCSTGSGNGVGAGNFSIYDFTSASTGGPGDRFFIQGSTGNVGVNTTSPTAKLHVIETTTTIGYGIRSDLSFSGTSGGASIFGSCIGSGSGGSNGVLGFARAATLNTGGFFNGNGNGTGTTAYGVCGTAFSAEYNYGVYGSIGPFTGGSNPNTPDLYHNAGYFNGDVVTTSVVYYFSDRRLKKDIAKIDNSLTIINKLNPVTYNFDTESTPYIALPHEKQYGFISQEVKDVLPDLTKLAVHPAQYDKETGKEISPKKEVLSLNYNGFIAILAKGIQEQQRQIEDLKQEVASLKTSNTTDINQNMGIESFELDQNIPNPFNNETVIKYNLPQSVKNASLLVYDLSGKQLASFPLTEKGTSSLTITSEKLAAGIYIYSVMADGKILDSKRMVVANK